MINDGGNVRGNLSREECWEKYPGGNGRDSVLHTVYTIPRLKELHFKEIGPTLRFCHIGLCTFFDYKENKRYIFLICQANRPIALSK